MICPREYSVIQSSMCIDGVVSFSGRWFIFTGDQIGALFCWWMILTYKMVHPTVRGKQGQNGGLPHTPKCINALLN